MEITDWIRGLLRDGQYRPGYHELQELSEKAERAAGVYNHEEFSGLIRRYRRSDEAVERIALAIAKSEPFYCPTLTMNRYSIEMMKALADTPFMESTAVAFRTSIRKMPLQYTVCSPCTPSCAMRN